MGAPAPARSCQTIPHDPRCPFEAGTACGERIYREHGIIPDSLLDSLIRKQCVERETALGLRRALTLPALKGERSIFCHEARLEYRELEIMGWPLLPNGGASRPMELNMKKACVLSKPIKKERRSIPIQPDHDTQPANHQNRTHQKHKPIEQA